MRRKIVSKITLILLFIGILTLTFDIYPVAAVDSWPMFHHDLTRLGHSSSYAPDSNLTLWTFTTGGPVSSSPAAVAGKIYFGSQDKNIYCLNASTGTKIWNYTTGNTANSPTVVGNRVYVGSNGDKIYCLDASTGASIWNYTTYGVDASPAVADGRVYFGAWDKWFYCLNASNGALIWKWDPWIPFFMSSAAVVDGRVYVGSQDRNLYCMNASTGMLIWNYTTGNFIHSSPAVTDGRVYVGSNDHKVYCLNASTGALIWNYTTGGIVVSSPAVANNRVYIGSADWSANVYCLNVTTGVQIWNHTTDNAVHSSPAVADGRVYVGSYDENVYCFDALTGTLIWKYKTEGDVLSSPAIADGRVYVGSFDNKVYAFVSMHACDSAGNSKSTFNMTDNVYVRGQGFPAINEVKVYLIPDGADALQANAVANVSITTNSTGGLPVTLVWSQPLTLGEYDIWVDVNQNGVFDGGDVWDSQSVGINGFVVIPEFSTLTSMLLVLILLTVAITIHKRRLLKIPVH